MYNFVIFLYYIAIKIASLFSRKAKDWMKGRQHLYKQLKSIDHGDGIIWIHCSSLGEYEQGIPLIIDLKKRFSNNKILVTFFSPSGYNHKKVIHEVDYYFYIPIDTIVDALRFVNIVKPLFAIFIKYEFWYNMIWVLKDAGIPTFYVSCNFRRNQYFFKWYSGWFRHRLRKVTYYFVQNEESKILLNSIRISNVLVTGDTRYDRVAEIANSEYNDEIINNFKFGQKLFIAGSSWEHDELIIMNSLDVLSNYKVLLVPHIVSPKNIERIAKLFDNKIELYSTYSVEQAKGYNVMVVDCMGKLSYLYRYADIAYIGGGFGKGIHNTLEAAVYGIPVIFGPKYRKFNEAVTLVDKKGGFSISNQEEFTQIIKSLSDGFFYNKTKKICGQIVESNIGATDKIILKINELVSLKKSY